MLKGRLLHTLLWDTHGRSLSEKWMDAHPLFELYETEADPFTLRVDELKELWIRYCKERGILP